VLFHATSCPAAIPTPSADEGPITSISLDDRLAEVEAGLIAWALRASSGNKSRAAELLHIKRTTLADRISRHASRLSEAAGLGGSAMRVDATREHEA
jgi:DNA-binding NtrC family response regulator